MANNLVHTVTAGIAQTLSYLTEIQDDLAEAKALVNLLGWELPPGLKDIGLATINLGDFLEKLDAVLGASDEEWEDELAMLGRIAELTLSVNAVVQEIHQLAADLPAKLASFGDYVNRTQIHKELPRRLFDFLLINYLARKSPLGFAVLHLINVIDYPHYDADRENFQIEHVRATIHYHLLKTLVTDPARLAREAYGWGTPQFLAMTLLQRMAQLLQTLGLHSRLQPLRHQAEENWLQRTVSEPEPMPQLVTFLHEERGTVAGARLGLSVFAVRPTSEGASDAGLGVVPIMQGQVQATVPLFRFDDTFIDLSAKGDILKRLAMILRPDQDIKILTGHGLSQAITGRIGLSLRHGSVDSEPKSILLFPGGFQLTTHQVILTGGMEHNPPRPTESLLELALLGCRFACSLDQADGFLQQSLSRHKIETPFDIRIGWTSSKGIFFHGGSGLNVTIPLNLSAGPLLLKSLHLSFDVREEGFDVEASTSASLSLGPIAATVDRLGLLVGVSFRSGNLGVFGLSPRFKPPHGLGLSIDAQMVVGGGFLRFDPQKQEYIGMLDLVVAETIAVKATGLLITQLPGGRRGYSLVVLITAEGFQPVPLPLGFRLTGIGGLLAINRTFEEESLRSGLKSRTLESVMFPKDPVRNASQIVSALNRVFPPAAGHHLFGPMAKIEWGTPTLISAELAVVLEFGARLRLLILARVLAILPKPEHDLVRLQMDAVGVLDFDQGTAALDATLYDSRLLKKFVLTGDMAMRLKWEGSPHFALAIGGLHPAFSPPSGFPKLERIALNLTAGDNPRFRCEAYFALTANTLQFGARAELHAAAHGFSIQGETGFDVLIQLDPFHFLADFYAQVQLKRGSTNLFKVRVEGALAGPRPLHLKAKATFEVLWWDVSIRVDRTLIAGEKPPPPEPIEVLPRLQEALGNPANWMGRLPEGQRPMVTLRPRASSEVALHPLGTLTIKQGVVPLDMEISRFGSAVPAGGRRFTISSVSLGGQPQKARAVKDFFAPAQFFEMSDEQKLSRPSFELLTAGVGLGSEEIVFSANPKDWLEVAAIEFDTIIVDKEKIESRPSATPDRYRLSPQLLGRQARFGAAGGSGLRRSDRAKYRAAVGKYRVEKIGWQIVATTDLAVQPMPGLEADKPATYSEAAQALEALRRREPAKAAGLKILRSSDLL